MQHAFHCLHEQDELTCHGLSSTSGSVWTCSPVAQSRCLSVCVVGSGLMSNRSEFPFSADAESCLYLMPMEISQMSLLCYM